MARDGLVLIRVAPGPGLPLYRARCLLCARKYGRSPKMNSIPKAHLWAKYHLMSDHPEILENHHGN